MKKSLFALMIVTTLFGCSFVKGSLRTVNDLATILCEMAAKDALAKNPEALNGFSPKAWCAVHEHLGPFIDQILQAKEAEALRLSGENKK